MTITPAVLAPSLTVSEIFGPTIQGEGASLGKRASFVRLGGCNLSCTWCDTPYTWDASRFDLREQMQRMEITEILNKLLATDPRRVVISGGEPLLQQEQEGWFVLLEALYDMGIPVEVETNGTRAPNARTEVLISQFNVSPKLGHAGDPEGKRIVPEALAALAACSKAQFKFVCRDKTDVDEVATLIETHNIPPHRVWVMPEGTEVDVMITHLRKIADYAIGYGFNVTTRLHTLIWGDERGK